MADAVAQEGAAGERAGRVDGDDAGFVAGPDGPVGQAGRQSAFADAGGTGDADADRAAQAGDEAVTDLGQELGLVLDLGDQTGAGQPLAGEEPLPEIRGDGKTRAIIGIHILSLEAKKIIFLSNGFEESGIYRPISFLIDPDLSTAYRCPGRCRSASGNR